MAGSSASRRISAWLVVGLGAMSAAALQAASARAEPIDTLKQLGPALAACWRPPAHSTGSQVTLAFSLSRTGALIGAPRITYAKLLGDGGAQRVFVAAALRALSACLPVSLSSGLGGAVAGRPLTIRFIGGPQGTAL